MSRAVPHPRLLAEAEAWPVGSDAAFRLRTTRVGRRAIGVLDAPTAALAEGLDAHLRLRSGGQSLANITALRDRAWFGSRWEGTGDVPLADYLLGLAETYLARSGHQVTLRTDGHTSNTDLADRAAHWRWLSLRLPADLLVAAMHAPLGTPPPSDGVALSTAHLERVLQRPVAETHLHVGAAFGFPLLWTSWMNWLGRSGPDLQKLQVDANSPFENGEGLRSQLLAAAVTRVLLAAFLWRRELRSFQGSFETFETRELLHICEQLRWPTGAVDCRHLCSQVLAFLRGTAESITYAHTHRLYAALTVRASRSVPKTLDALRENDPLSAWLHPARDGACSETLFAARALHYLLNDGRGDARFAELFWQYERVRCLVHAHLVQEPGTSGLDWFSRHYRRLSPLRGELEPLRFDAAVRHQSRGLQLGALEMRTTPPRTWTGIRDEVRQLARTGLSLLERPTGYPMPELGLLFHFIKEREHKLGGRPRLHADPGGDPAGFRFGVWYRARRREALAIQTALFHHPELLLLLRGLDIASTELAVPTWAAAPLLTELRESSVSVSAILNRRQPAWGIPPLQVTCHAGEDFSRLVEGLRRIHELHTTGALRNGDRLGHGLALGTNPHQWAESASTVVQSAEERLDDLLWELERYGKGDVGAPARRLERVRSETMEWARRIYGPAPVDLDTLLEARRLRHSPAVLQRLGFPDRQRPPPPPGSPESFVLRYLTDVGVFRRGQELVEVRADQGEVMFLEEVQHWLCALLARLEVTVESNPSSNLLIGDLLGLEEHPILSLTGRRLQTLKATGRRSLTPQKTRPHLLVSINSDDPITFATSLVDEYAYLYVALLRRRVPSAEALEWIESLRENGMRSRFTRLASTNPDQLMCLLPPERRPRRAGGTVHRPPSQR
jgi:hypothetical protein